MVELNKIYNEECLEGMKKIEDKSIDMILCDLPYEVTSLKWDKAIPLDKLWEQYERIIKDNGAIILTAIQPFTSKLVMSNPKLFKHEWIWSKTHGGFASAKYKPLQRHESVLAFSKGKINYYPQKTLVKGKVRDQRKEKSFLTNKTNHSDSPVNPGAKMGYAKDYEPNKRYPTSIIEFSNRKDKRLHPTQKPVALFEYLVKTYSNEGDTILDNCMGSGTTAIACINTNRNYIGFELDEDYYDIANERIKKHKEDE